jgi:glycine/D-amino acid oxidase-like deaminating enzyme/nitrite reductase/ring-hydroxylating ferredoxin subunit
MGPAQLGPTDFRDVTADVLVIGAGITGVTTAALAQRAGLRVAVLDAGRLGASVTTHATVKVTVGHGTAYSRIEQERGTDAAAAYAAANLAGYAEVMNLIHSFGIDCDWEQGLPHVVYAERAGEVAQIENEAAVAARLGLPAAVTGSVPVPFEVAAAVGFENQAQFHPGRYLAGLAEALVKQGGVVMEEVRVLGVDEDGEICHVDTTAGRISAPHVVVATHHPILDRGGQFARMTARRSYGIAGVLPAGVAAGMTINVGTPTHSTRTAALGGETLLIVVGEGHEVGSVSDTGERWSRLRDWAAAHYGVADFRYHWSAQEIDTLDHVPFVGFISPASRRILTGTGYGGWGITNGTAAAIMMRDLIVGEPNPWVGTFDARRAERTLPGLDTVKQNVHIAKTWLKDRVGGLPKGSISDLAPGEAATLEVDGKATAAYRDEDGTLHAVSAICTHLKCNVRWNAGERSWDCPCHGSRFGVDGEVLHGPATMPLEKRTPS